MKLFAASRPALLLVTGVSAVAMVASGLVLGGSASAAPARGPGAADITDPAAATASRWRVSGPRGSDLDGVVRLDDGGEVALDVIADGDTVLSATRLGLRGSDGDLTTGLTFVERRDRRVADSYTMTTGKSVRRSYVHTESVFTFADAAGARLGIAVRVSRDGVAYRYLLDGAGEHRVDDESGAWEPASDGPAWMQRSYAVNYEAEWTTTTAAAGNGGGSVGFPVLFQQGDRYALVTEADLHGDYSGAHLTHAPGSLRYDVDLFEGRPVTSTGALSTPWRVAIVGDLPAVVGSNLVDDLATPSALDPGTDWIKPGRSSWSWLTDWDSPRDEARQRDFVDLAARNGWEYVLLDEGWNASWVPRTVRYAHTQGVDVIAWFHSRDLRTQEQRDEWLPRLKSWGISGIKVDFMDSDSQEIHRWYDDVARDTARYELMINFHGSALPTGMQRTWPHIMSYESVRGMENGISPERSLIVPFTRNVVGSMDFTPVVFSRDNDKTSKAQQVAMSVAYESGWQHISDKPEGYAAEPNAMPFLQNLPTTWDEVRLLSGTPGRDAVLARRSGDRWFVGGLRAGSGDPLALPLEGLTRGKRVLVDLLTDDGANGSATVHTTVRATSGETLEVPTANNGGFVAVVCEATRNRESCLEPVVDRPDATLAVDPAEADVEPGSTVVVRVTFTVADRDVTSVGLTPELPAGWTADQGTQTVARLAAGEGAEVAWQVQVPAGGATGTFEVPIAVSYRAAGHGGRDRYVAASQATLWVTPPALTGTHHVSDLDWLEESNGYGPVERDRSNGEAAGDDGRPITIAGVTYAKGVGMHATGSLTAWLGGTCTAFSAVVGIDDEVLNKPGDTGVGSVRFRVYGDGVLLTETPVLSNDDGGIPLDVDVTGVRRLRLVADEGTDGKNFDHADWADARVTCGEG
ncbi:glycoside hydrolase family 97 catalytic domain-containing protein [Promicromonospora sp. NPDC023805]|uniref:glycoside hydrolase family 97 catalytic domain-containing protein n=1 Tax=Promicromonospora sp. NPDC023805 TaxID=3154696 RepID=UPI0033FC99A4